MDKEIIKKRHDIGSLDTATLLSIAGKSKYTVLAEKFLNLSFSKNKIILRELEELKQKEKKHVLLKRASFLGFAFAALGSFFISDSSLSFLVADESTCRLFTAVSLSMAICSAMLLFDASKFYILVPPIAYIVYSFLPRSFFRALLGSGGKRFAFLFLTLGLGAIPASMLFTRFALFMLGKLYKLKTYFFGAKKDTEETDIASSLQKALDEVATVKKNELEELVKQYHPEYAHLLDSVKDKSEGVAVEEVLPPKEAKNLPKLSKDADLPFYLGVNALGEPLSLDLAKLPHMVVGGTTGAGKSNFLKHLIATFLGLENTEIILVDTEQVDYAHLSKLVKLVDYDDVLETIQSLLEQMATRKRLFLQKSIAKLGDWKDSNKPPRIVLILDEYADLVSIKSLEDALSQLARKGRKWGIHIVLATQRPDAEVISKQIKSCLPCILALRCANADHARVLKAKDAYKIPEERPGLAYLVRSGEPVLYQTPPAVKIPVGIPKKQPLALKNKENTNKLPAGNYEKYQLEEKYQTGIPTTHHKKKISGSENKENTTKIPAGIPSSNHKIPSFLASKKENTTGIPVYQPGKAGQKDVIFIESERFYEVVGVSPQAMGLKQKRRWVDGAFKRGYFVKKIGASPDNY